MLLKLVYFFFKIKILTFKIKTLIIYYKNINAL